MNRQEFAQAWATNQGWPASIVPALVAVMLGEDSQARCNPADDELVMPGSSNYNDVGVQNYPSVDIALQAYSITLSASRYAGVRTAGANGVPSTFVQEWAWSGWGTWDLSAQGISDLAQVLSDPSLSLVVVAGTVPAPAPTEEDALLIISNTAGGQWLLSGGKLIPITDPADTVAFEGAGVKVAAVTDDQLAALKTACA